MKKLNLLTVFLLLLFFTFSNLIAQTVNLIEQKVLSHSSNSSLNADVSHLGEVIFHEGYNGPGASFIGKKLNEDGSLDWDFNVFGYWGSSNFFSGGISIIYGNVHSAINGAYTGNVFKGFLEVRFPNSGTVKNSTEFQGFITDTSEGLGNSTSMVSYADSPNWNSSNVKGNVVLLEPNGTITWTSNQNYFVEKILPANDLGAIAAGFTNAQVGGNPIGGNMGNSKVEVSKLDINGNILWEKNYGALGNYHVTDLINIGTDGYLITGYFNSTGGLNDFPFYLKIDNNGEEQFMMTLTEKGRFTNAVELSNGDFLIAGYNILDPLEYDALAVLVSEDGTLQTSTTFGGSGNDRFVDLLLLTNGKVQFVGKTNSTDNDLAGVGADNANTLWVGELQLTYSSNCSNSIPDLTFLGEYNNHNYFISNEKGQPDEAQIIAEQNGGYLAAIANQAENDFIQQNISEMVFIGLNDLQTEGTFEWYSGEPFSFDNIDVCSFCNENNEYSDYVVMHPWDGKWSFGWGDNERKYIVEIPCQITGGTPDFTLSNMVGLPTTVETGDAVTLSFDLNNIGTAASTTDQTIAAFLSTDQLFGSGDTYLADLTVGNTPIGTTAGLQLSFDIPNVSAGDYYVIIIADVNGDIQELNTSNNGIEIPLTIGTPTTGSGCPNAISGFTLLGEYNNSKYFISNETSKPTDAQLVAEQNSGYLVAINDQAENDFIRQNISEMVYIGLNDAQSEGNLQWTNGDTLTYNNINPCGFCNENSSSLDYVIMAPWNGTWSFSSQWNSRKYIVEIPCGNTPSNDCNSPAANFFEKTYPQVSDVMVTEVIQTDDLGFLVFGTQTDNFFLMKTNNSGDYQWSQSYGSSSSSVSQKVLQTSDGGYLMWGNRTINGQDFSTLIKVNANGNQVFENTSATNKSLGNYRQLSDGSFILLETPVDENDVNGLCMRKIDANGNDISSTCIGGLESLANTNLVTNKSIEPTDDGNFLLIGSWNNSPAPQGSIRIVKVTPTGTILWTNEQLLFTYRRYTIKDMIKNNNGDFLLMGEFVDLLSGQDVPFFYYMNPSGEIFSERNYFENQSFSWNEIALDANEDILLSGNLCGQLHPFNNPPQCSELRKVFKYTATGDYVWSENYLGFSGGSSSIKNTNDGGFILSGHHNGEIYLVKINEEGNSCSDLLPDLTMDNMSLSANQNPNSDLTLFNEFSNIGTENSTLFTNLSLVLSTDNEFSADDIPLQSYPLVSPLLINQSGSINISINFPNVPDGDYFIIAKVDAQELMEELDESNNVLAFPYTIGATGDCPSSIAGFEYLGEHNGHQYFLSDDAAKPTNAQAIAEQNGGYLAVTNNQAENNFIQQNISEMVYIGLNDTQTEGTPAWVEGTSSFTNFDICSFCNENSNSLDYVVMHNWNGGWSWSSQWNSRKYIVEIPCPNPLVTPPIANTLITFPTEKEDQLMLEAIMPNPADNQIYVSLYSTVEDKVELQIFDARGVLVKSKKVELHDGDNTVDVSIQNLPGGFYFLKIPQAQVNHSMMRFVKVRD